MIWVRVLAACGWWVACLVIVIPLSLVALLLEARGLIKRALGRRREKARVSREIRDFNRELDREMQEWR